MNDERQTSGQRNRRLAIAGWVLTLALVLAPLVLLLAAGRAS